MSSNVQNQSQINPLQFGGLGQDIPSFPHLDTLTSGFLQPKNLPTPFKFTDSAIQLPPTNTSVKVPIKPESDLERQHSFSVDQVTIDSEIKKEDSSTNLQDEKPSSLVFNIRRFSKNKNKFVLLTRHRKLITKCEHSDKEYYAKGMCKKCYHNKGERSKFATSCGHPNKFHYAKGLCKGCYLTEYHKDRKTKSKICAKDSNLSTYSK